MVEPVAEPMVEPVVDPVVDPAVEPTVEPVVDPVVEPEGRAVGVPGERRCLALVKMLILNFGVRLILSFNGISAWVQFTIACQ